MPIDPATLIRSLLAVTFLGLVGCATPTTTNHSLVATPVPAPAPTVAEERAYLGLTDTASEFTLDQVQAELLIIDCFDMYCHACQSGAKRVHDLYDLVQERGLGHRIRFLGLGVGNTPMETAMFKRKLSVPFPAIPDRSNEIARQFGTVRLPSLIVLRRESAGWRLVLHQSGIPTRADEFLDQILDARSALSSPGDANSLLAEFPMCEPDSCPLPETRDNGDIERSL